MTRRSASPACINLIRSFEGICDGDPSTVNLDPYPDPLKIWSIGWGHAIRHDGRFLRGEPDRALAKSLFPGGITVDQAVELLANDVTPVEIYLCGVLPQLTQNQFDALVCFCFNVGLGNFEKSTMFRKLKADDIQAAADQFLVWDKGHDERGNLVRLRGLTRRRAAEAALFKTPMEA